MIKPFKFSYVKQAERNLDMKMNREEKKIRERFGTQSHFIVPEGYFGQLTQQVMERLPEQTPTRTKTLSLWRRYRTAIVAAACTFFAIAGVGVYHQLNSPRETSATRLSMDNSYSGSLSIFDEMVDYTMTDSDIIYASLSDYEY